MQRRPGKAIALFAAIASMACVQSGAQQPSAQQPGAQSTSPQQPASQPGQPAQPVQARQAEPEEGFFKPRDDPALTRVPDPMQAGVGSQSAASPVIDAQALEAQQRAREAAERDLDRAAREHREAQARVPAPRPIVISPLDGTAGITSPLDGTASILSPIGR